MRGLIRGLAVVGLAAGVGYAVFALTRLARETSVEQIEDFTPAPSTPSPNGKPRKDDDADKPEQTDPTKVPQKGQNWPVTQPQ